MGMPIRRPKDSARRPKRRLLPPMKMILRPRMRSAAARVRWSMRMIKFSEFNGALILTLSNSGARRPSNARPAAHLGDVGLEVEIKELRLWLLVSKQEKHCNRKEDGGTSRPP